VGIMFFWICPDEAENETSLQSDFGTEGFCDVVIFTSAEALLSLVSSKGNGHHVVDFEIVIGHLVVRETAAVGLIDHISTRAYDLRATLRRRRYKTTAITSAIRITPAKTDKAIRMRIGSISTNLPLLV